MRVYKGRLLVAFFVLVCSESRTLLLIEALTSAQTRKAMDWTTQCTPTHDYCHIRLVRKRYMGGHDYMCLYYAMEMCTDMYTHHRNLYSISFERLSRKHQKKKKHDKGPS